ncbi:type IV toxin-antitoxin system AbiEi family antitoxin [Burkholderia sp. PU8-34]
MSDTANFPLSEQHVLDEACAAFERATQRFDAKSIRIPAALKGHADGVVRFTLPGHRFDMPAAVSLHASSVQGILARLRRDAAAPALMLVTRHVSADLAARLIEHDIPFLDAAGNAYLNRPEAFVMITGRPKPARASGVQRLPTARATTPKGMRIMFALATRPGLVARPYRAIAEASGVALGTVNLAMDDLAARGLVGQRRNGERVIADWTRFVQEWVALYPSRLRAKLPSRRFSGLTPDWWREFDFSAFDARLGGEPAADLLTHDLKPAAVTIYTHGAVPNRFLLQARLRPDELGDVEILEAFWAPSPTLEWRVQDVPLVPPLLVYADLVATGDSRNLSAAATIHDQYLAQPRA